MHNILSPHALLKISKLCSGVLSVTWWMWDGVGISRVGVGDEEGGTV